MHWLLKKLIYEAATLFFNLIEYSAKVYLIGGIIDTLDSKNSKKAAQVKKNIAKRLGRPPIKSTNSYEDNIIAESVVSPDDIKIGFDSIGGLEGIKKSLYEAAILPLRRPELFNSDHELLAPQKGVLLYGPPGTGKTMLAKAIAKESGAIFLNVNISTLMSAYHGDTEKHVNALFTLALKLQPCIIFLDEADGIFYKRQYSSHNNEHATRIKNLFMALWDGFATDKKARVMVLAATNRPSALDEAILRRLPKSFEVGLPDCKGRAEILKVILKGDRVDTNSINFNHIAALCDKYSGSDLLELCKQAAYLPIRDHLDDEEKNGKSSTSAKPRLLTQMDLEKVVATSKRTEAAATEFEFGSSELSYYI